MIQLQHQDPAPCQGRHSTRFSTHMSTFDSSPPRGGAQGPPTQSTHVYTNGEPNGKHPDPAALGPAEPAVAWREAAPALAAWTWGRLVNRHDAFGQYRPL